MLSTVTDSADRSSATRRTTRMRPFRNRFSLRLGASRTRGPVALGLLSTSTLDQQLMIAGTAMVVATLAFLTVRSQIATESRRLAHAGFTQRFDGVAWVHNLAGGGLTVIQPEPYALRPQMAALGFIAVGLIALAMTMEWARHSPQIRRFLGALSLVGLLAGGGSMFRPRSETLVLSPQSGTIRSSRTPGKTIPIRNVAGFVIEIPRWNTRNRGYRVAVDLRNGGSPVVMGATNARTARDLTALLSAALGRVR